MRKKKLVLPEGFETHNGWNWTLTRMLAESKMFDISTERFPYVRVDHARNGNWSMMRLNDVLIGLDTWDTWSPSSSFKDAGFFNNELKDVNLILKIQYYECEYWNQFQKETGIPVKPWTVMPTKDFPLEAFQWQSGNHKWISTVTGKNCRFGRQPWTEWCEANNDFYSSGDYVVNDTLEDYIKRLESCKWGIILKGKPRNHDGKNRRECEFASCGIPMALNYEPTYTFPMVPGQHYVKLEKPEDMATLRDIDPEPFALASRQLYYDHFSAYGIAKTLIDIVEKL
jgi:hypothetical protein